ncbi:MAG: DNA methyltransferase [Brumimicrobium sp.]
MDGASLTPEQEKLNALKQVLPEVFTEGKVDWEKLKATLGEDINFSNERYVLNWAGKSEAFKVLQTPTTKTLVPAKDESVNFDDTEHIFIEGENLEVLKVLQKSYFGKVKMIYIDPPYNTGNDSFIYPDKFSETKSDYEKRVGDKDNEGYMTKDGMFKKNSKENGQYHSNWLNMMMPRLYLAKNLLKQDGIIFISIDDNEVHNLTLLMNEIFGEENFIADFLWKKKGTTSNVEGAQVSSLVDSTLCYRKSDHGNIKPRIKLKESRSYPHSDAEGNYRLTVIEKKDSGSYKRESMKFEIIGHKPRNGKRWQIGIDTAKELEKKNRFIWDGEKIKLKIYDFEDKDTLSARPNLLFEHGTTDSGAKDVEELFGVQELFDNPKPKELISELINIASDEDDIILDFFAGSATTAHSTFVSNLINERKNKFILVQLPELCKKDSEAIKLGFNTISSLAMERIKKVSQNLIEENPEYKGDLGFKVLKLADSNFKQWQQITGKNKQALEEQMKLFVDPVAKNATTENMVYELLLKSGKDLNSTIETKDGFYAINETELVLILEKANQEIIDAVIASKPQKVIALDKLFKGNDQLKTNASLQMKDAGIEFKTI